MRKRTGLIRPAGQGVTRCLLLSAAWVAGAATTPVVGALFSPLADEGPADPQRAQTPLSEISGAKAPPPVTVAPLDEVPAVQAAYQRARARIEDRDFQTAIDNLTETLEEPGGDRYEIHYLLALAQARLRQFDAARASAETAARLGHGHADVHYLLGGIYLQQGEIESAIPHLRSATLAARRELNNVNVTLAWYHLGQTLAASGYNLAAAGAYEHFDAATWQTHPEQRNAAEIAALLADRPHGMVPQRLELLREPGRVAEAVRVAEWAREIWPDDVSVARLYAETLLSAGRAEQAFAFCRERWDDPERATVLLPVAVDAARAANRLEDWVDSVARGVAEGRNLEQAEALTRRLNRVGAPNQAIRLGQALLAQQPLHDDLTWQVAAAQQATGNPSAALQTLITYVRNKPDLAEVSQQHLAAWVGWFETGVNVVELVKELRARADADFATDFVLGVSALAADQLALADELLQSCIAARPDFAPAYVVQGEALLATYQWDAAKAHANQVLKERPDLAAAHYVLAEAHDGLDENQQAQRAYKQAIKLRPEEPAYKLALARHYRRLDNLLGAQRYFQAALTDQPGHGEALEGLIDCYLRGNKVEIARAQLKRIDQDAVPKDALRRINTTMRFLSAPFGTEHLAELEAQFERYPDDIATARMLAGGLYLRGRLDEAYEVVQRARAVRPDDYHSAILQANVHALRGEFDQAISLLDTLVARFPNRLTVLEPLALFCLNDFRLEEGRAALRRLIELDQDPGRRSRNRRNLRDSFLSFGECDGALELVEGWIAQRPENEDLVDEKIKVLLACDRNDEAFALIQSRLEDRPDDGVRRDKFVEYGAKAKHYDAVADRIRDWLQDDPDDAALTNTLIDVLLAGDRPDEALEVARKFEGTYAESILRRIWLGRCQAARGQTDTALAEFDEVLAERLVTETLRAGVREVLIDTLIDAERYDDALRRSDAWLKEAEDLDRNAASALTIEVLLYRAKVLHVARRDTEYIAVMEALLEYLPGNSGLLNDLGYTWVDLGLNLERATAMVRRAVAANPWNAAFIDSLGWAYYKAGDFSNAHKYLARAVRLRDGQDAVVYDHLADAAYRLGDRDAAREHWIKALSLAEAVAAKPERVRLADSIAAIRAKLAALERSEPPNLAPTAAEQQKE